MTAAQQLEAAVLAAVATAAPGAPPGSLRPSAPPGAAGSRDSREIIRDVWFWNFDVEFDAMLLAVEILAARGALVALDMEFPGFVREEPRLCSRTIRYQALRENVDALWPVQVGIAVADAAGGLVGVWTFNLRFDAQRDAGTAAGMAFLAQAGLDFRRHLSDGIPVALLGLRLAASGLFGFHCKAPWWLTFSGSYDLGYLLKLISCGRPLPMEVGAFEKAISLVCPWRHELRDHLPHGSLDKLGRSHGVARRGAAHTAGSDALLTLELFLRLEASAWSRPRQPDSYTSEHPPTCLRPEVHSARLPSPTAPTSCAALDNWGSLAPPRAAPGPPAHWPGRPPTKVGLVDEATAPGAHWRQHAAGAGGVPWAAACYSRSWGPL